ncbi:MAG: FecR domain-containing protein [Verrucomicrobia bacterium]|jgi:hypothetical protein|nr:FecR domain-containing protein [Verrucomicrobiota bacterium]
MKNRFTSRLGLVAMAFLLATAVTATADTDAMTKAKVVRIKGSARFTTGTGSWQPLKVGDVLNSGTVIQTAADSRVDLVLGDPKATVSNARIGLPFGSATPGGDGAGTGFSRVDQNFVRLMENTVLSVDKLSATDTGADVVTDTQLDLRAGRIFGTVKKLSAGSRYEVKIPNGVAGVRGTIYMLSSLGDCMVFEGSMAQALVTGSGDTVRRVINANQRYDPRTDLITDLNSQERAEGIANTGGSQQVKQGSNPWGPVPPNGKDNPYVSPTQGSQGPPPGKGPN